MTDPSPPPTLPVTLQSPLRWLALGWADLRRNPVPGLVHGLLLTAFGWLLLWAARDQFWLLAGAFSGFLIVAPILATGLYQVSRQRGAGLGDVVQLWRSGDGRLVKFGLLLGLAGTGWVLTSAGLITLWSPVPILKPVDFLRHVVLVREMGLFEVWLLLGALLAAPVFASTVVALPMLVDTQVSVMEAVAESWRAVASHPGPMVLWAVVIGLLVGLGMATALLGLIVLIPLLAHASWHAYRDLTVHRTVR
ncbi:DUF2189 domain-containing protein [Hydrogenophaga sp.]|uniref:DUF2189 domain-containing protein n=1 Tax=Hydrogenophaga sp. TaxID=1904254 RepID=UPI0027308A3D|nr:DUF2189 domain-containing protein [Hydrogenophaga sp.]MDP2015641.1 DUF2189 domain-containing protein [Hydrogenophaga sp.]MDP3164482.1 DUF2189 domain-containing protein [Hydrogenophaga sp.]MDP3813281.1 DUF2189 domain-containing protein [Hydrogenophaga sp.]